MVSINEATCNACGQCLDACPTGALILQNNRAFIHQELCEGCEACVDACPEGAIRAEETLPVFPEVIRVAETPALHSTSLAEPAERPTFRELLLPAIGSALLWTGRELVPRLGDLALSYLDRRTQSPAPGLSQRNPLAGSRRISGQWAGGRRRRQRQRRRSAR